MIDSSLGQFRKPAVRLVGSVALLRHDRSFAYSRAGICFCDCYLCLCTDYCTPGVYAASQNAAAHSSPNPAGVTAKFTA